MGKRPTVSPVWGVLCVGALMILGCSNKPREIPERYRGQFAFDKTASVAYWEAQSDWPQAVNDSLLKMAIPTTLTIEAKRIVVTDVGTGQSREDQTRVRSIRPDSIELDLHSNFAQTNRITTFQFDEDGFWLLEGTLFPNYRERFKRIRNP